MLLSEFGFMQVTMDDNAQRIDIVKANDRLVRLSQEAKEKKTDYLDGVIAFMTELGFPECSQNTARLFSEGVFDAMDKIEEEIAKKKSADVNAASPGSMASTLSA